MAWRGILMYAWHARVCRGLRSEHVTFGLHSILGESTTLRGLARAVLMVADLHPEAVPHTHGTAARSSCADPSCGAV